jgi:hypothetical protein
VSGVFATAAPLNKAAVRKIQAFIMSPSRKTP